VSITDVLSVAGAQVLDTQGQPSHHPHCCKAKEQEAEGVIEQTLAWLICVTTVAATALGDTTPAATTATAPTTTTS
jgi:hypothetical protein